MSQSSAKSSTQKNAKSSNKRNSLKKPNFDLAKLKANPYFKQRLTLRLIILILVVFIAVAFADSHGYWAIISAIAILASDDLTKIPKRSALRLIGAFVGFFLGSLIALIDFGLLSTIIFLVVGVFLASRFLMTEKYALGSAGIGLAAVAIASLISGDSTVSSDILGQRLLWTTVGAVIVISTLFIGQKLYQKKPPKPHPPTSQSTPNQSKPHQQ